MRVTIHVSVSKGASWHDEDIVHKEIEVITEHTDNPDLPWGNLCAGLVEATIKERLATLAEAEEQGQ